MNSTVSEELLDGVARRLAEERSAPTGQAVTRALRAETSGLVSDAQMLRMIRQVQRELVGSGPLADLLAEPDVTDVVVNAPDDVRVDRGRGWERTDVRFADEAAVQRLARRLAAAVGRRLDEAQPFLDARLPDGVRLHAVLPPLAATGTCLSLRVLRPVRHDLDELDRRGAFPGVVRPTLAALIAARLAFLVSGGTGAGKTTVLGALLSAVPGHERVIIVEDAEELRPPHPHTVRLIARTANVEGAGAVGLRDLVRQALRMRPDRIVVGEVRGPEVVDLLAALNTGHEGGGGTLHANAPMDVPARVEALAALGGMDRHALSGQLAGAVQVVVQVHRSGSRRTVAEIAVLTRGDDGSVKVESAIRDGRCVAPGVTRLAEMLRARGVDPPW